MEKYSVIFRVDQPTYWCAAMVCVPKANSDKVRICVDLTKLNDSVRRETFPLPVIEQSLGQLAGSKYFTKLDCNSSFWQVKLTDDSKLLTTFVTPFGRYAFNRLPFGIASASEYFQKRMFQILEGLDGVLCQTDDVLVHGKTEQEHDQRLNMVLTGMEKANLTLNPDKCEFSKPSVKYVGYIIGSNGISADPDKVKAICDMKPPTNIHEVRRFLGMVNQLGKFTPKLAENSKPIRDLLSTKNQFYWGPDQQSAFENIKQMMTSTPILALYDPNKDTVLMTDASGQGIGNALFQKQENGDLKPVSFSSRALTPTEKRYSTIEKEALGVTYGCLKNRDYLIGRKFHIVTDHKPLISLLGQKDLSDLPIRIQRFRLKLMAFMYTISHVPGKNLVIPDLLSRHISSETLSNDDLQLSRDTDYYLDLVISDLPATDRRLDEIRQAQGNDLVCQVLSELCQNGWPKRKQNASEIGQIYWSVRGELVVNKGLLMKTDRLFIPIAMRQDILSKIHETHQGILKCKMRAKESVWWIGINSDIEKLIKNCDTCAKSQNDQAEPMKPTPFPSRPWERLGSDLFFWNGHTYLLVVDYYSRFIELSKLGTTTSMGVIDHMKSIFSRHGYCDSLITDGGPQYSSEQFKQFMDDCQINHITSSPKYPLGNSEAERAVQTVKKILEKNDDPYIALLNYRATPLANGLSPSELLFGRKLKTHLPQSAEKLLPTAIDRNAINLKEQKARAYSKQNYDRSKRARALKPLETGDNVFIKDFKIDGKVIRKAARPSLFVVKTPRGIISRNRRHLVKLNNREIEPNNFERRNTININNCETPEIDNYSPRYQRSDKLLPQTETACSDRDNMTRYGRLSKQPVRLDL